MPACIQDVATPIPFMNPHEIHAICLYLERFNHPVTALEWGSGNSTIFFSARLPEGSSWDSYEHDPTWHYQVTRRIADVGLASTTVHLVKPSRPFHGLGDGDYATFQEYVSAPEALPRDFDFILVDGRARTACMSVGWRVLNESGIMVLHDAQRVLYDRGIPQGCYWVRLVNPGALVDGVPIATLFMAKKESTINDLCGVFECNLNNAIKLHTHRSSHLSIAYDYFSCGDLNRATKEIECELLLHPGSEEARRLSKILSVTAARAGAPKAYYFAAFSPIPVEPHVSSIRLMRQPVMYAGDGSFSFEMAKGVALSMPLLEAESNPEPAPQSAPPPKIAAAPDPIVFLQVHTFYPDYLNDFYRRNPGLTEAGFQEQINALVRDGFSGIHIFAPYLGEAGYRPHLVVANNPHTQRAWLEENGAPHCDPDHWIHDIVRLQVESIRPEVIYLSDPINFDARFLRSLSYQPKLVLGWRAANIPPGTDWSGFDIILSSLALLREVALKLGAREAEHFFPGFPTWINPGRAAAPEYDVVFSGSWTTGQHASRNHYLARLAKEAASPGARFSLALYLNAPRDTLPPEVRRFNLGPRFGIAMHEALRSGRIVIDARGSLEYLEPATGEVTDLAGRETANMRIFEVTGSGRLLLTEQHENLSSYFDPGAEIETFRDEEELIGKIRYYLDHPDEREAIARRGQERCLTKYSMEVRSRDLDRIVRSGLKRKDEHMVTGQVSPVELRDKGAELLASGSVQESFDLVIKAKALKEPLEGIDLLRARCFLAKGDVVAAAEALREELRLFPDNGEAKELLDRVQATMPATGGCGRYDEQFQEILAAIRPYTMLSEERLFGLYTLARAVCENDLPGNFVECGVAAGGSSALLAFVIRKYSRQPRRLFAFDSFCGMPPPTEEDAHQGIGAQSTGWGTGTCSAPEASVREICTKLGVAEVVTTVNGYFEETLPTARDWTGMIALLHLDGDWYSSTRTILENLYDRLVEGAILQIDDYGYWDGCRKAIHEFEESRGLKFSLNYIDGTGVWYQKPDTFPVNEGIDSRLIEEFRLDDPAPNGVTSQMSTNERFQLYYALRTQLAKTQGLTRFVEIGSFSGASLLLSHQALRRRGQPFQAIAIEPGGTDQFHKVVKALKDNVIHLPMFSHDAARRLGAMLDGERRPQFILIDGDHTYEGVRRDILNFYPLLNPGGLMVFHDYLPEVDEQNRPFILHHHGNSIPGVRRACRELIEETYGCEALVLPLLHPSDPTQTQPQLPIIPGVFSTLRAYRKPLE